MSWKYQNKIVKKPPPEICGFIYKITFHGKSLTAKQKKEAVNLGFIYVGKKVFSFFRKKLLTKKEKLLPENKRKRFKIEQTESNWQEYWGSNIDLNKDIEKYGAKNFSREILEYCCDKKELTYKEVWWQFKYDVLASHTYNGNIAGRYFKSKFSNKIHIPEEEI